MGATRAVLGVSGRVIASVVTLVTLALICTFAFGLAGWLTAPFRGEADERARTEGSGSFRLTTYEDFFDLCGDVQDKEGAIAVLEEERETASAARRADIDSSLAALRVTRLASLNEYNSKAAQEHRAAFKDQNLPARLKADEHTECAP